MKFDGGGGDFVFKTLAKSYRCTISLDWDMF